VPGWLATLLLIVTVYGVLLVFVVALIVSTARFADLLPTYKDQMASTLQSATDWLHTLGVDQAQLEQLTSKFDLGTLAGVATSLLSGILGFFSGLVFLLALLLFLGVDAAWFPGRLDTTPDDRRPLAEALHGFAVGTRSYLLVSTVFGLIVAILDTVALSIMGIPAPLVWGMLAFLTNYIPNIGFVIGLVPPMLLGLLEGGVREMLAVLLVYCLFNVVIQSVIQPRIVGSTVGLSTSLTFLSLIFWAWVLGALGALLAIPLSLLVKALFVDIDPGSSWIGPLINGSSGARPALEPVPADD
jgi:AI-2 transport protein TqsA